MYLYEPKHCKVFSTEFYYELQKPEKLQHKFFCVIRKICHREKLFNIYYVIIMKIVKSIVIVNVA